jgi:nicotinamidase-related amidase
MSNDVQHPQYNDHECNPTRALVIMGLQNSFKKKGSLPLDNFGYIIKKVGQLLECKEIWGSIFFIRYAYDCSHPIFYENHNGFVQWDKFTSPPNVHTKLPYRAFPEFARANTWDSELISDIDFHNLQKWEHGRVNVLAFGYKREKTYSVFSEPTFHRFLQQRMVKDL